jgi:hypothetical protein
MTGCRPALSTLRAGSDRERAIASKFSISSSVIANSTACRHGAVMHFLVRLDTPRCNLIELISRNLL